MAVSESVSYEKIKHKKKMTMPDRIFYIFVYTVFILFACLTIYPVIHFLVLSFNDFEYALRGQVQIIPNKLTLDNYINLFTKHDQFWQGVLCTILRTFIGTVTALAVNAMLAFILSRRKFLFKSGLSLFWTIALFAHAGSFPFVTTILIYKDFHLMNTFWVYIIPGMVGLIYLMVMRTYMKGIPDSLEEAAQLDGAGYMRIFWSIVSPVCKPVYAAIALFIATYHWNSWIDTMLYNRVSYDYTTLGYELMKMFYEVNIPSRQIEPVWHASTSFTVKAAAYILAMLPVILIYPIFQRYFLSGIKISHIKD